MSSPTPESTPRHGPDVDDDLLADVRPVAVQRPAARYGAAGPVRRHLRMVVVVTLGAAVAAWAVWAGWGLATERVDVQVQGYKVVDDSTVLVTFAVTKAADLTVVCSIEALGSTQAQVGLQKVTVGADAGASSVQTATVRTQQRAVTGVVKGCTPA